jgi:hypothetical protein
MRGKRNHKSPSKSCVKMSGKWFVKPSGNSRGNVAANPVSTFKKLGNKISRYHDASHHGCGNSCFNGRGKFDASS